MAPYPDTGPARDRFILERRPAAPAHDPWRPQGLQVEDEAVEDGRLARTATVFLTGRECPWRCVMCDLWRHTVPDTPPGAIPAQLAIVLRELADRRETAVQFKLYNASSFFDSRAVPPEDYDDISRLLTSAARVIVESHPALISPRIDRFITALERAAASCGIRAPALEVAMGLETAHDSALERLNKRMTVDDFRLAAGALVKRGVSVRAFLLLHPPFVPFEEQDHWLLRSIDVAFAAGASVVSLIPTRPGNGALDELAADRAFVAPALADVERAFTLGMARTGGRGRLFLDLWDLARISPCQACRGARRARLEAMNHQQAVLPVPECPVCGGSSCTG